MMKYLQENKIGKLAFWICLFIFIFGKMFAQDLTDANMKAILIYQFAKYTTWENEDAIEEYKFGIYGEDAELLKELKTLESVNLKNKPIKVIHFTNSDDISDIQLLYVTQNSNIELKKIQKATGRKNTLLITDQCKNTNLIMINLLPLKDNKIEFEVNKANLYHEGLNVSPEILLLGGTEVDIAELYKESQKSLVELTEEIEDLNNEMEKQKEEIEKGKEEIENLSIEIQRQNVEISYQQKKLNYQKGELANNRNILEEQQKQLDNKAKAQVEQQQIINNQKKEIEEGMKVLSGLEENIEKQENKIEEQKSELTITRTRYQQQRVILWISLVSLLLILGLAFFVYKAYRIKKEANREIYRQKEEILAQAEELQQANEETTAANEALEHQKEELTSTLENLKKTQSQLIQSAKMASLGQLTAGVAHELNNPINFINGNVSPLKRDINEVYQILESYESLVKKNKLEKEFKDVEALKEELNYEFLIEEINKLLEGINEGANRTSNIVIGLRSFSRLDEDEFKQVDIHEVIESTLTVLHNKIKNRITINKNYGDVGLIECLPTKINQVFMNILSNGIQAIEGEGEIAITTTKKNGSIQVSFKDNGQGMTDEVKKHIFEPFYTTKDVGKGTGLGLSISFGIVENHNGEIRVESDVNMGSEFIVTLPKEQKRKKGSKKA